MRIIVIAAVAACVLSCGDTSGPGGNYKRGEGTTKLLSTSLATNAVELHKTRQATVDSSGDLSNRYYYITPSNVSGKILTAMMMVGKLGGDGPGGSAIELIYPSDGDHRTIKKLPDNSLLTDFNFQEPLTSSYPFSCCSERYPADENARISTIEMLFGYIDIDFTITEGPLSGPHTVRIAYITIDNMGFRQGDILYKEDNTFKWYDTSLAIRGLVETRPAAPVQNAFAAKKVPISNDRGNPYLSTIWSDVPDSLQALFPKTGMFDSTWAFTVDFKVDNGVVFRRKHPGSIATIGELLQTVDINANIRDQQSGFGLKAKVSVASTGGVK